jgi:hypothetical protein
MIDPRQIETALYKALPGDLASQVPHLASLLMAAIIGAVSEDAARELLARPELHSTLDALNGQNIPLSASGDHIVVGDITDSKAIAIGSCALAINIEAIKLSINFIQSMSPASDVLPIERILICPGKGDDLRTIEIPLVYKETKIGRPHYDEQGPEWINLPMLFPDSNLDTTSRSHAKILQHNGIFELINWGGRNGIRVGHRNETLLPGNRHMLRHGTVFHIPDPHGFSMLFLSEKMSNEQRIFNLDSFGRRVYLFQKKLDIEKSEFHLLEYLYHHHTRYIEHKELEQFLPFGLGDSNERTREVLKRLGRKLRDAQGFSFINMPSSNKVRFIL